MKNLKVKRKFLLVFGIILFITLFLGFTGIGGMFALNHRLSKSLTVNLPNTIHINNMQLSVMAEQNCTLMALQNARDAQALLEEAAQHAVSNADDFQQLKESGAIDPALISELETCLNSLAVMRSEFKSSVVNHSGGYNPQAEDILQHQLLPAFTRQMEILDSITTAQDAINEDLLSRSRLLYFSLKTSSLTMIIVSAVICFIFARKLNHLITVPLNQIKEAANSLENGDFSKDVTYQSRDEFGETCSHLHACFEKLHEMIEIISQELLALSDGDFSIAVSEKKFPGETVHIQKSLKKLLSKLNASLGDIKTSASQIADGAIQVSNGAQALAQGAAEQASTVENLSSHINDVSHEIISNAESAKSASSLASEAGSLAHNSLEDMKEMTTVMNDISKTSQDIGNVIKVIDDIAFQTNILALNAAVEAARAGSAGKGFAVVADEVRNLAAKSADAAQNTTDLIENAMSSVRSGVDVANKTNKSFSVLVEKVESTMESIEEISQVSVRQAEHMQQITTAVDQISAVVQTNSATSEEDAAASEELSSQAAVLNQIIEQFNLYIPNESQTALPSAAPNFTQTADQPESAPAESASDAFSKY